VFRRRIKETYFRRIERNVFSLEESSGIFSGTTVVDMVSRGAGEKPGSSVLRGECVKWQMRGCAECSSSSSGGKQGHAKKMKKENKSAHGGVPEQSNQRNSKRKTNREEERERREEGRDVSRPRGVPVGFSFGESWGDHWGR
jgi:hypothetical protein